MTIDYSRVDQLQKEDKDLLIRKNTDYGNSNLITAGLPGIATRLLDKVSRLNTLAQNPDAAQVDESLHDTLRDVSNYGLLGRMLLEGQLNDRPATVYLAGPIDLATEDLKFAWRDFASTVLLEYGVDSYSPVGAWRSGNLPSSRKAAMDSAYYSVWICDMVLAYLPADVPTIGTIREIEFARSRDKRVVVASPWAATSAFSADLECHPSVPLALAAILEITEDDIYSQYEKFWKSEKLMDRAEVNAGIAKFKRQQERPPTPEEDHQMWVRVAKVLDEMWIASNDDMGEPLPRVVDEVIIGWYKKLTEAMDPDKEEADAGTDDREPDSYFIGTKRVPIHQDQPKRRSGPDRVLPRSGRVRSGNHDSDRSEGSGGEAQPTPISQAQEMVE